MGSTAEERETIINWSDADEGVAHLYTCQARMMRKLAKHPQARLVERHTDEHGKVTGEEWDLPAACVRITAGRKRQVSEAEREAARQRMRAIKRGVRAA